MVSAQARCPTATRITIVIVLGVVLVSRGHADVGLLLSSALIC